MGPEGAAPGGPATGPAAPGADAGILPLMLVQQ
jgi:hypothetical protein